MVGSRSPDTPPWSMFLRFLATFFFFFLGALILEVREGVFGLAFFPFSDLDAWWDNHRTNTPYFSFFFSSEPFCCVVFRWTGFNPAPQVLRPLFLFASSTPQGVTFAAPGD